jgi:protein-S-isoprenylcysteine O-methyltransferase Ste14
MNSEHQHGIGEEHQHSHLIQTTSLIVFIIIWSLDSFVYKFSEGFMPHIILPIRLGLFSITLIIALYLIKAAHDVVFDVKETSVITTGVYAYVRHPMYLGTLLIYISFTFLTMSLISLVPFIVIFFLYNRLAATEEKDLERILGQEYGDYKKRVARWVPILF